MAKKQTLAPHEEFQNLLSDIQKLQDELAALYFEKDELQYQICKNIEMEYMLKSVFWNTTSMKRKPRYYA
jgi:hypothetical protein